MKKYEVSVTRIGYAHTTIEVEAESEEQAEQKAIDMAGNYDFSEHDADYECEGVTLLDEPEQEKQQQPRILITAELEIGDGTGYDGMKLFDVPVDGDISEEDFLNKLTSLMDVDWEPNGDFCYVAITDPKQNEKRCCHLLATLEY